MPGPAQKPSDLAVGAVTLRPSVMLQSAEGEEMQAGCSAEPQHHGFLRHGGRDTTQVPSRMEAGNLFRSLGWVVQGAEPFPSCHRACSWVPQGTSQLQAQDLS